MHSDVDMLRLSELRDIVCIQTIYRRHNKAYLNATRDDLLPLVMSTLHGVADDDDVHSRYVVIAR